MARYINFHTHKREPKSDILQIFNYFPKVLTKFETCSMGIHPWYINENLIKQQLELIKNNILNNNILLIGECGLDKLKGASFEIQMDVFIKQIKLSEKYNIPLLIHCVKAYNEVIDLKNCLKPKNYWVLHRYSGSQQLTTQLVKTGFFFSLRLHETMNEKTELSIKQIPLKRIFFETDDSNDLIENSYKMYSNLININIEELKEIIEINYNNIFVK
ncbi:MAG: TatD family hydrolase [Bacteroidales bacterium]|nr:TatD family hydrolase [Bacteroidales bacterium]